MLRFKTLFLSTFLLTIGINKASADGINVNAIWPPDCLVSDKPLLGEEKICGPTSDFMNVRHVEKDGKLTQEMVSKIAPAVGRLSYDPDALDRIRGRNGHLARILPGSGYCTVTLVNKNHAITAAHCFEKVRNARPRCKKDAASMQKCLKKKIPSWMENGVRVPLEADLIAELSHVVFDNEVLESQDQKADNTAQGVVFDIVKIVEIAARDEPDYAIIELAPDAQGRFPGKVYGTANLAENAPNSCEQIAIIHHPEGRPKVVTTGPQAVKGTAIHYNDVDTSGGSSGGPIFDMNERIVGIHTTGKCGSAERLVERGTNWGVTIKHLMTHSKFLGDL